MQRMARQRARRRRREHDCDIIGHVTRPSLRAGGDRARSEGPGRRWRMIRRPPQRPASSARDANGCAGARERERFQARRGQRRTGEARFAARRVLLRARFAARRVSLRCSVARAHRENAFAEHRRAPCLVTESLSTGRADRDTAPRCCSSPRAARRGVSVTDARDRADCERCACPEARSQRDLTASRPRSNSHGRRCAWRSSAATAGSHFWFATTGGVALLDAGARRHPTAPAGSSGPSTVSISVAARIVSTWITTSNSSASRDRW
jgi:hypothetical protein